MRRIETVVDVTDAVGTGEPLGTAVTVVLPPDEIGPGPVPVLFGYPGGGYSRHYFDLQLPGGYSQAEYHARRGLIFVACDHLAVGDSDVPSRALDFVPSPAPTSPPRARSCSVWPQAPSPTVSHLSRRARSSVQGSLRRLPADACAGSRPVVRRSRLPGLSGIETVVPWTQGVDLGDVVRRGTDQGWDNPRRPTFFRDNVPRDIVERERDLTRTADRVGTLETWGTAYYPGGPQVPASLNPMTRGAVAAEAATIDVPVLVATSTSTWSRTCRPRPVSTPVRRT